MSDKILLEDQVRDLKKKLKIAQRGNGIIEALSDSLIVPAISPLPRAIKIDKKMCSEEDVVLHLSDEHCDVIIKPNQVGGLEQYNFNIALGRAEVLVEKIIRWCFFTLKNISFKNLYILANGDHVNGEIHNAIYVSEWKNALTSALNCGKMHALMFRDLAAHFENVHVLYTPGNHGRRTKKKDFDNPLDNWDYMVAKTAELSCKDIKNIHFIIPDAYSYLLNIKDHIFYISHGDDIKSWNAIPYYGIERKTNRLSALLAKIKKQPKYYCFGHFHQPSNLKEEVLINGAWLATTPYVFESLSGFTEPSQLLHGVHSKHGISWRLNLTLRDRGYNYKPVRYVI